MIYILSGEVRTGKTSALLKWCIERNDVDGVLCPDDENGKRFFLNIKSQEAYALEDSNASENLIISVGPFNFLKSAFKVANKYLIDTASKNKYNYLILDELGKLELKDEGLYDAAKSIIPGYQLNEKQHLILIVRESLLNETIKHYNISQYSILQKEDLYKLK